MREQFSLMRLPPLPPLISPLPTPPLLLVLCTSRLFSLVVLIVVTLRYAVTLHCYVTIFQDNDVISRHLTDYVQYPGSHPHYSTNLIQIY